MCVCAAGRRLFAQFGGAVWALRVAETLSKAVIAVELELFALFQRRFGGVVPGGNDRHPEILDSERRPFFTFQHGDFAVLLFVVAVLLQNFCVVPLVVTGALTGAFGGQLYDSLLFKLAQLSFAISDNCFELALGSFVGGLGFLGSAC